LASGLPPYLLSPPPLDSWAAEAGDESADSLINNGESKVPFGESEYKSVPDTSSAAEREPETPRRTGPSDDASLDPGPAPNPSSRLLHYQDGTLVARANEDERRAFLRYRESTGEDPGSLSALRTWYAQQVRI
jgi:hypothetical protein